MGGRGELLLEALHFDGVSARPTILACRNTTWPCRRLSTTSIALCDIKGEYADAARTRLGCSTSAAMKTRYLRPRWHVPRLLQVRVGQMWRCASSIDGQRWSANFPDTPGQAHPGPAPGHPCKWKWIPSSIPGHLISCRSSLLLRSARRSLLLYRVACSPTESPASHPRSLNRFIANLTLFTLQAHVAR